MSASLLAVVLGSVHGFSIFIVPLESVFGASRAMVSLTYSIALVTLTIAVLFGHRLFAKWLPGMFVFGVCLLAASGAIIAAFAPSLPVVWFGYSVLFGGANGLGYGFGLQIAGQIKPGREGFSMGVVTAAYALGAAVSPALFAFAVARGGFATAMIGLAGTLVLAAAVCAALLIASGVGFKTAGSNQSARKLPAASYVLLWLGYGAGTIGGLMTIGHAAGIARTLHYDGAVWVAPVAIAVSNLAGSLTAGRLIDRVLPLHLLAGLPLISVAGFLILAFANSATVMMACFAVVGFAYGGIIAAYPAVIAKTYGAMDSPRIYGRVFTAWGTAGLCGPWLAGRMFDLTGNYQFALATAGVLGFVSIAAIWMLLSARTSASV